MEHYSAIKKNEVWIHPSCINLENITLSEKPNHKDFIGYDSIYVKHTEHAIHGYRK